VVSRLLSKVTNWSISYDIVSYIQFYSLVVSKLMLRSISLLHIEFIVTIRKLCLHLNPEVENPMTKSKRSSTHNCCIDLYVDDWNSVPTEKLNR
jgi:hypothetical protein